MLTTTYYELLGINISATEGIIRHTYRRLAMRHHPDRNAGSKTSEEVFKQIQVAYRTLSDPVKRRAYDASLRRHTHARDPFETKRESCYTDSPFTDGPWEEEAAEIFVSMTLEQAVFGCKKKVSIPVHVQCTTCQGRGRYTRTLCENCMGSGGWQRRHIIWVNTPAGGRAGDVLGITTMLDGVRRRMLLRLTLRDHWLFVVQGADIACDIYLPLHTALFGGEAEIPTLDGVTKVRIQPGTRHGMVCRVRGRGLPRQPRQGNKAGDLLCRVFVEIPTGMTPWQRAELEQAARNPDPLELAFNQADATNGNWHYPQTETWREVIGQRRPRTRKRR